MNITDEHQKTADVHFAPMNKKDSKITAGGLFIGHAEDDPKKADQLEKKRVAYLAKLLQDRGSIQLARKAYSEKYPDDFITAAFRSDAPPRGFRHSIGKLLHTNAAKEREAQWELRSGPPRVFLHAGLAGGPGQSEFYRDVARGLYADELQHVPKMEQALLNTLKESSSTHLHLTNDKRPTYSKKDAVRAIILSDLKSGNVGGVSPEEQTRTYNQLSKPDSLKVVTAKGKPSFALEKISMTSFFDELEEIEKQAFGLKALGLAAALGTAGMGGAKALPKMMATKAPTAMTQTVKKQVAPALMPSAYKRIGSIGGGQSAQLAAEGVGIR